MIEHKTTFPGVSDLTATAKAAGFGVLLLFLISIWTSSSLATSIVVVAQSDTVLIGADSKRISLQEGQEETTTTCKILWESGFAFAAAGIAGVHSNETEYFNVLALVQKIARESDNVHRITDKFMDAVKKPLAIQFNWLRQQYPHVVPPGPALSTVFVTFENNHAVVLVLNFRVKFENNQIIVDVARRILIPPAGQHLTLLMGTSEKMSMYNAANPDWPSRNAIDGVQHLISLEIEASPNNVGPPIDVLLLKAEGGQWIQKKKECSEGHR